MVGILVIPLNKCSSKYKLIPSHRFLEKLLRQILSGFGCELLQLIWRRAAGGGEGFEDTALNEEQQTLDQIRDIRASAVGIDRAMMSSMVNSFPWHDR
jgi:hypothetical protein